MYKLSSESFKTWKWKKEEKNQRKRINGVEIILEFFQDNLFRIVESNFLMGETRVAPVFRGLSSGFSSTIIAKAFSLHVQDVNHHWGQNI